MSGTSGARFGKDGTETDLTGDEEQPGGPDPANEQEEQTVRGKRWRRYVTCLNENLDGVNPLIGREEELERTMQILCRKEKTIRSISANRASGRPPSCTALHAS